MSTERTACGIELYAIAPGICDLCKYETCFVGAQPPFKAGLEDNGGAGYPLWDMSDEDIDMAYEHAAAEQEWSPIEVVASPQMVLLEQFPEQGKFEGTIYRPSAKELSEAMPDWTPAIESNQLVLVKELVPDIKVKCWSSILVGQIAGGTGDDSIRVIREDTDKNGKVWRFKNEKSYWVTRQVPQDINTPEKAAAHLAGKIEGQVAQFSRPCLECGAVQVKCRAGHSRNMRYWWKGTCEHKVEDGW